MNAYHGLSIIVCLLIAAIIVREVLLAIRSFSYRKKVELLNPGHPELANTNQFAFSIGWLGSLDSIIIVTLSRRLCIAADISEALASLPVIMTGIGSIIGIGLFRPFRDHTGTRSIVSFSYALYTVSALICMWFVGNDSLTGICFSKIIGGVAAGLLNAVMYRLPSLWKDNDEGIRKVTTDTENGLLTAGITGVFAGGILATYVSYVSIYLVEAITAALFFFAGRFIFVKKESRFNSPDKVQKRDMSSSAVRFIFTPVMISFLLIFVVYNGVALCYKQIVFPMFSDGLGFSEQTISNMYILVRCLVYFTFGFVEKKLLNIRSRGILIGSQVLMGLTFLVFLWLDTSFLWASAMLLITGILCKLVKNHGTVLWNRELYNKQVKSYYANPILMAVTAAVNAAAPGILSLQLSFGVRLMGLVMGLTALCSAALYALMSLKNKKYISEETSNESSYR